MGLVEFGGTKTRGNRKASKRGKTKKGYVGKRERTCVKGIAATSPAEEERTGD